MGRGVDRVLVVCTANLCRSPMAAALIGRAAARRGRELLVRSAGVAAVPGLPAPDEVLAAVARLGVDISDHRSQLVGDDLLVGSDLVLTMESNHVIELVGSGAVSLERAFTLVELVTRLERAATDSGPLAADASLEEALARTGSRTARDLLGEGFDIEDPIGGPPRGYRRCARSLERWSERLGDQLWGGPTDVP